MANLQLVGKQRANGTWHSLYVFTAEAKVPKGWKVASHHKTYEAADRARRQLEGKK